MSVEDPLIALVLNPEVGELGRFHALWTLEGLGLLTSDFLLKVFEESQGLVQNTALRLLESFAQQSSQIRSRLATVMENAVENSERKEALQLALSSYVLSAEEDEKVLVAIFSKYGEDPLMRDAMMSSLNGREYDFLQKLWASSDWENQDQIKEIFWRLLPLQF